jgi:predicted nicotinamide N-methyase
MATMYESDKELLQQLKLVKDTFYFGGQSLTIERVSNLDDLVDNVSNDEFNHDERLPYWAELWPSAIGLSRFLIRQPELLANKSVMELGCGLGLTSLISALHHPSRHLLTDYEPGALMLSRRNFERNNLPVPAMQIMDWRDPEPDAMFERIVASDVIYEERFFEPLINMFRIFLEPGGLIILAEPNRSIAGRFFRMLKDNGFQSQVTDEIVSQNGVSIRVSIHLIMKSSRGI